MSLAGSSRLQSLNEGITAESGRCDGDDSKAGVEEVAAGVGGRGGVGIFGRAAIRIG